MRKIQLSIPEPCHEQWDNMTPTLQGRFCNACAKEVIDFSNMSDSEVLGYFIKKKKTDNVCGLAYPDQLDRDIAALPKKKKHWRWYYVLSAFLFMMKPAKTKAQGGLVIMADSSAPVFKIPLKGDVKQSKNQLIQAQVKDEAGNAVAFASIVIGGTAKGTQADEEGWFSLVRKKDKMTLEVSALGYETKIIQGAVIENEVVLVKQSLELKEVVVTAPTVCVLRRSSVKVTGLMATTVKEKRSLADTIKTWWPLFSKSIQLYPNPVSRGSSLTIHLKMKQTGNCTIQVVDAAGRLMSEQKLHAGVKNWKQPVNTNDNWSSGMYFVKVLDDKGMLIQSGSLSVQ